MANRDIHWKTNDGRRIAVKDMSDSHLLNAHRFMRRRSAESSCILNKAWSFLTTLSGEMAQDCMEREIDNMEDRQCGIFVWIWAFKDELDRRGLTPLEV